MNHFLSGMILQVVPWILLEAGSLLKIYKLGFQQPAAPIHLSQSDLADSQATLVIFFGGGIHLTSAGCSRCSFKCWIQLLWPQYLRWPLRVSCLKWTKSQLTCPWSAGQCVFVVAFSINSHPLPNGFTICFGEMILWTTRIRRGFFPCMVYLPTWKP